VTSRRDFLGLLAVAPVAVPAAIEAAKQPRYASGGFLRGAVGIVGEECHGGFAVPPRHAEAFRKAMASPMTRGPSVTVQMPPAMAEFLSADFGANTVDSVRLGPESFSPLALDDELERIARAAVDLKDMGE
jgi:hypothetical protein